MTTATKIRTPDVKSLGDFRRLGLIGRWFGELQLIGVHYPQCSGRRGKNIMCRLSCAQGHGSVRAWLKLQYRHRLICSTCALAKKHISVGSLTLAQLGVKIAELSPERRRLMEALLANRRRIEGEQDISDLEQLKDAYIYAIQIAAPEAELRDLAPEGDYETYGKSASLGSPSMMYVAAG